MGLTTTSVESAAPLPTQRAYIKPFNTQAEDAFGTAVALSGDTVIVGAPYEDSDASGVNGTGTDPGEFFDTGAAYIYVREGTNWMLQAYVKASTPRTGNLFGSAVAISGDTAVVGAVFEDSSARGVNGNENDSSTLRGGAVYVFVRNGTNWTQQAYLKASNNDAEDQFGYSVAISDETILVGADYEGSSARGVNGEQDNNDANSSGAVYVFVRTGTNWTQQAYIKASNSDNGDEFGTSVSIDGNTAVVGSVRESSAAVGVNGNQNDNSIIGVGAAYVFVRDGTNWSQQAYLKPLSTAYSRRSTHFGSSVSIHGDTVAIGAQFENTIVGGSGAAFVFSRIGTNWQPEVFLKAPYPALGDNFGTSIAVQSDRLVVGAPYESGAGATHLFERHGTDWIETDYFRPPFTGDGFGLSLAVSGATVAIGSAWDDSSAVGFNGNPYDASANNSGAAYLFEKSGGPHLIITSQGEGGFLIEMHGVPGASYRLLYSPTLLRSADEWEVLGEQTAPASGTLAFHDASVRSGQGFYRVALP